MASPGVSFRTAHYFLPQTMAEVDFSRGFVRDMPRSSIPPGGVYDMVDYIPDQPGLLRKRGGWATVQDVVGSPNNIASIPFSSGKRLMVLASNGHMYDITSGKTDLGSPTNSSYDDNPIFIPYMDGILIGPSGDGASFKPTKIYVSGGNLAYTDLGGSPPYGRYACAHVGRPCLASSTTNQNRIWFGPAPNPEDSWDLSSYIDTNNPLSAIASVQGVMLAFSQHACERITGSIPPNVVGEDMSLQPFGQVGCADARSIVRWGSYLVFASQDGVHITNGAGFDSLTEKPDGSGILSYWRPLYADAIANGGTFAAGLYSYNYYIISVTGTTTTTLCCYLPRKAWFRLSNIQSFSYSSSSAGVDELYAGSGTKVVALSGMFSPSSSNKSDGDGTNVLPLLETRMIGSGIGLKSYEHGHLLFDMEGSFPTPSMTVQFSRGMKAEGSYTAVPESPFSVTTGVQRKRFILNQDAESIQMKFTQTSVSDKTEIYAIEVEQRSNTYSTAEFTNP